MRKIILCAQVFLGILIIFGIDCRDGGLKNSIAVVGLKNVLTIGGVEEESLLQWVGVAVDEAQNIFVSDMMDFSIKKFDSQGRLLLKNGRKGQGTGEFQAPRFLDYFNGRVYVSDQIAQYIQVFDANLSYLERIPTNFSVHDFQVISDNRIIIVSFQPPGEYFLVSINRGGEVLEKSRIGGDDSQKMYGATNFAIDESGNRYFAYNFIDRIEKTDPQGKSIWSRELKRGIRVQLENKLGFMLPTKYIYKDIAIDRQHRVFVLGGSYSENKSRDVYILRQDGELLGVVTLKDTSHCIFIDKDGFLYSRADEGMTLLKSEIDFGIKKNQKN